MPDTTEDTVPATMIGPATTNIFAIMPNTIPSLLNSIAGETTEFANPVIGTIEPPPALTPILSYTPIPVKNEPKNIMVMLTNAAILDLSQSGKANMNISLKP